MRSGSSIRMQNVLLETEQIVVIRGRMEFGVFDTRVNHDGLVEVVARGEVTAGSFVAAAELHWIARGGIKARDAFTAITIDMRAAYALNGYQSVRGGADVQAPRFMRELPTAIIAPSQVLHHARAYGMACAELGALVGAFTNEHDAAEWALARGRALMAQRRS